MAVKVIIPTPLRQYAGKNESVVVEGATVDEIMGNLMSSYGELKKHLYTDDGKLRSFVNIYRNDEDIRYLERGKTPVKETDVLSIVPSIAGGADPVRLSNDEVLRYSRHLIMPEVSMEGQLRLKQAKVLLIGSGGLGAPLGLYLAAAGVGRLGLVDFDVVDVTNLQRQIIHSTPDVGRPKLDSARDRLKNLNPHVDLVTYETRLTSANAMEIFKDYDIIADGTDNFPTRYLVNDACVLLGKPNVYGSIYRFEGQASVFASELGPCYRCLYPEPPPPGLVPSCAEGGVLGILPGLIGVIQATEVVKLILGKGNPLIGRLLLLDALEMKFRELKLRKNPECPICGPHRTIHALIDYEQFCGIGPEPAPPPGLSEFEIDPVEVKKKMDRGDKFFLLDVREPHEVDICKLPGSYLIPLGQVTARVSELNSADDMIVYCRSGQRSGKAVDFLRKAGFRKVKNMKGGTLAWSDKVDPSMPKY